MIRLFLVAILVFVTIEVLFYPDVTIHWINKYKHGICSCRGND